MISEQQAKIQQTIALLQEVLGNTTLQGQVQIQPQTIHNQASSAQGNSSEFENQLKVFQAKGKQIGAEIAQLTIAAVSIFRFTLDFVKLSQISKRPDHTILTKVQETLKSKVDPIIAVQKVDKYRDHAKAIKELINASFWVLSPQPEHVFIGAIEPSQFNANRFRIHKIAPINEWYNTIFTAVKNYKIQILSLYKNGITYNNNGTGNWNDLFTGNVQQATQQTGQQIVQTSQPVKEVAKVEQKPLKRPSKTNTGGNWFVSHFSEQTIQFSAEEAVMRSAFFIQNCNNCTVKIDKSKFKSVMVSKCENINLIVRDCISGIQIMNCKSVQCQVLGFSPSISVDKSEKVHVILNGLNKETDILSSKVTQLNITYTIPNSDNLAKDQPVPEQIVTKWNSNNNRFESIVYDKFM